MSKRIRTDIVVYPNNTVLLKGRELGDPGKTWFATHHVDLVRKNDYRRTKDGIDWLIFATGKNHGYDWSDERKRSAKKRLK